MKWFANGNDECAVISFLLSLFTKKSSYFRSKNMYMLRKRFSLQKVMQEVSGDFTLSDPNRNFEFDNISPLSTANENSVCFIGNEKKNRTTLATSTQARIIVMSMDGELDGHSIIGKQIIHTDSPRTILSRIAKAVIRANDGDVTLINPSAKISKDARIGNGTHIGSNSIIGNSRIGDRCVVMNNVIIEDGCVIGDDVYIGNNTVIGSNALSVILAERQSQHDGFPQLGGVIIENGAHIDSFSSVQRGTFGNTHIKKNVKIDSYVQIAHNVEIGERSVIIGHSKISGSVKVGDDVFIGQSVTIGNIGSIGSSAYVCMGSVVIYDIDPNTKVFGNPAKPIISPKMSIV